jgi:DNA repair exonuclease SbcCD ATPase subunit
MLSTVGDIADFYTLYPECIGSVFVSTRNGYKCIEYADITAYDSNIIRTSLSCGKELESSPEHRVMLEDLSWCNVKDLLVGTKVLTDTGTSTVTKLEYLCFTEDLYDLQVDGYEYYTNGIVSHNSTLLDAITFSLFGKPFRNINKPQLLNSITQKELLVELEFDIGKNTYLIRRGIKPAVFEIYLNDSLINQSAETKDYQEFLERKILRTNYKTFCQVVILGSASFVPFMQLPIGQRRLIIEDLLDLQVFSSMNVLLKQRINDNQDSIQRNTSDQKLILEKIKLLKQHLDELRSKSEQFIKEKQTTISDLLQKISDHRKERDQKKKIAIELIDQLSDVETIKVKLEKFKSLYVQLNTKQQSLMKDLEFFKTNTTCPTCKQDIDRHFSCEVVTNKSNELVEITSGTEQIIEKINGLKEELKSKRQTEETLQSIETEISHLTLKIKMFNEQIQRLEAEIEAASADLRQSTSMETISDLEKEHGRLIDEYNVLYNQRQLYGIAANMLKDGGIKTKIINQYVPIINKLINKYLGEFDLFVEFFLDEQFNEVIKSRHRDEFSYASFSEGEKQKIDLAILFTWRAIAKMRNSLNTNLLILDEIFDSSIDADGIDNLQKILSEKEKTNIFVISHRAELKEKTIFDDVLTFKKIKNFSQLYKE